MGTQPPPTGRRRIACPFVIECITDGNYGRRFVGANLEHFVTTTRHFGDERERYEIAHTVYMLLVI
jgi:hypothetical protein